jgi:hypothetical protein
MGARTKKRKAISALRRDSEKEYRNRGEEDKDNS